MEHVVVLVGSSDARSILGFTLTLARGEGGTTQKEAHAESQHGEIEDDEAGEGELSYALRRDAVLPRAHEGSVDHLSAAPLLLTNSTRSNDGKGGEKGDNDQRSRNPLGVLLASSSRQEEHSRLYLCQLASDSAAEPLRLDIAPAGAGHCVPASDAGIACCEVFTSAADDGSGSNNSHELAHLALGSAVLPDPLTVWSADVSVERQQRQLHGDNEDDGETGSSAASGGRVGGGGGGTGAPVSFALHGGAVQFEANLSARKNKKAKEGRGAGAKVLSDVARIDMGLTALAKHPLAPMMLSASASGELSLWDLASGRVAYRRKLGGGIRVESCRWSPSGSQFLLVTRDVHRHVQAVLVYDTETGEMALDTAEMLAEHAEASDDVRHALAHPVCADFASDDMLLIGGDLNRAAVAAGAKAQSTVIMVQQARVIGSFPAHENRIRAMDSLCLCGDGPVHEEFCRHSICVTASTDGFVKVWEFRVVEKGPTAKLVQRLVASEDTGARLTSVCVEGPLATSVEAIPASASSGSSAAATTTGSRRKKNGGPQARREQSPAAGEKHGKKRKPDRGAEVRFKEVGDKKGETAAKGHQKEKRAKTKRRRKDGERKGRE